MRGALVATLLAGSTFLAAQQPTSNATPAASGILAAAMFDASVRLQVSSPSIKAGAPIPLVHSDYGEKVSPELRWSGVPEAAKSLVILMEDPDAQEPKPFVHWILYNLPASMQMIPAALPGGPRLPQLGGALQGRTSRGNTGYFGPRPPKPDPAHHYHVQVFALDAMLTLDPGASRESLLKAMTGHVLAAGELMGTFKAPPNAK